MEAKNLWKSLPHLLTPRVGPEDSPDFIIIVKKEPVLEPSIAKLLNEGLGGCKAVKGINLDFLSVVVDVSLSEEGGSLLYVSHKVIHLTSPNELLFRDQSLSFLLSLGPPAMGILS